MNMKYRKMGTSLLSGYIAKMCCILRTS